MSLQLEEAKLELNRLSCDLPDSVLNWNPHHKVSGRTIYA